MKIRNGFVSNSSSSSFVVAFPRTVSPHSQEIPKNLPKEVAEKMHIPHQDLHTLMFGNEVEVRPYDHMDGVSTKEIVEQVVKDMKDQKPNRRKAILDTLSGGYGDVSDEEAEAFLKENKDKDIYIFNYGDEDGSFFCTMEHGQIFKKLPHIRISLH